MYNLNLGGFDVSTIIRLTIRGLSTARTYLDDPTCQWDVLSHSIVWMGLGSLFHAESKMVRLHLRGFQEILNYNSTKSSLFSPEYLQPIVLYCDMSTAVSQLSPPIFEVSSDIDEILKLGWFTPRLRIIRRRIVEQLNELQAQEELKGFAEKLVECTEVFLAIKRVRKVAEKTSCIYLAIFRMISNILRLCMDSDGSELRLPRARKELAMIWWAMSLRLQVTGVTMGSMNYPIVALENFSSCGQEGIVEIRRALLKWNVLVRGIWDGTICHVRDATREASKVVAILAGPTLSAIFELIVEYFDLWEQCPMPDYVALGPDEDLCVSLRSKMLGPIIGRYPILFAA